MPSRLGLSKPISNGVGDNADGQLLEATCSSGSKTYPNTTYESLEALLIAHSPAYVGAMASEIERRFAAGDFGQMEGDEEVQAEMDTGAGDGADAAEADAKGGAKETARVVDGQNGEEKD